MRHVSGPNDQKGFSLIETVVGMLILSVALLSVAASAGLVAEYSVDAGARGQRVVSGAEATTILSRLPWAELPTETECVDVPGSSAVERCVEVEDVSAGLRRFTVIVTDDHGVDTLQIERARSGGANPFNVP